MPLNQITKLNQTKYYHFEREVKQKTFYIQEGFWQVRRRFFRVKLSPLSNLKKKQTNVTKLLEDKKKF